MNEIQVLKSLKDQLDEIDRRVYDEVYDGYKESRFRILIGMWEKGEAIVQFRGVKCTKINFLQLERETDRDRRSLKQWHDIYSDYPDRSEYEEIAKLGKLLEGIQDKYSTNFHGGKLVSLPEGITKNYD